MNRKKLLYILAISTFVLVSGLGSLTPRFVSAQAQTSDPVFVGAGDIASCLYDTDEATAKLLDNIPGTVFTLGDNAYRYGTPADFKHCYAPTWGRHKSRTRPAPGNHDYNTAGAAGYFDYFGAAAGDRSMGYYSYDLGTWHLIALNSEIDQSAGSAQEQWLRADLAAHPNFCTLAYWHKPHFSSGDHGYNPDSQALWQALYEAGADVILNGHDHDYERFAPQNPNGQADPQGIREFVVGTGGNSLEPLTKIQPNSEVRNDSTYGVLKLTLHATSYDWQFVPIAGQTFTDAGTADCVGDAAAPTPTTMHVGELDAGSAPQDSGWKANVTITVHDTDHNPLANATVAGTWSHGVTGSTSCTTDNNGQCTISKGRIRNGESSVQFAVESVTRNNFTYTSSDNHGPNGSDTGSTVVVRKP
jgi:hypothetical protein